MIFESSYKRISIHFIDLVNDLFAKLAYLFLVIFNAAFELLDSEALCNADKLIVRHYGNCALCHRHGAVIGIGIKIE